MNAEALLAQYERIAEAPDAIARLRRFVLDLAVRGKLVPQDSRDEPASVLVASILRSKARLIQSGELRRDKPLPPITAADLPFDLPSGWAWVRLGEISQLVTSGSRDWAQHYADEGAIFVRMGNLSKGHYRLRLDQIQRVKPPAGGEGTRTRLAAGDILISITGDVGLLGLIPEGFGEAYINQHTAMVRPMPVMKGRYLAELFRSPFAQTQFNAPQRGIKNSFRLTDVVEFVVPLPPLAEQHRIVAKVDELMALCDRLEAARTAREATRDRLAAASLARLNTPDPETFPSDARFALDALPALTTRPDQIKHLRQTILNLAVRGKLVPQEASDEPAGDLLRRLAVSGEAVPPLHAEHATGGELPLGWDVTTIGQCFEVSGGIQKTPARTPRENAYPYLGVGNVYRGRLELAEIKRFELQAGELERYRLLPADILVVEGNGSASEIGRCAVWHGEIENCVHQNHIIRCRPRVAALTPFVVLYLNSPDGMDTMRRLAITSAGLFSLSVGKVRRIGFSLPPLAEQHRIVAKVNELMAVCDALAKSLAAATTARTRLLDAALAEALAPVDAPVLETA